MKYLGILVYILLQILFIPLAIIGFILVFYKQMYVSKKLGVSSTAVEVINGRWSMDIFGIRKDESSMKLNNVLPNNSITGLWLCLFPIYVLYKITGQNLIYPTVAEPGDEGVGSIVVSRTIFFDQIIEKYKNEVAQFVVMGAGLDTRCYGDLKNNNITFFELEQAKTQQLKIKYLENAGVDINHVNFVEVDFTTEHWYEKLESAGYDANKRTIFLWEGVTLYLSENDVRNTLQEIKEHSTENSVLVADLYSKSFVTGEYAKWMKKSLAALKITDEELAFGLDFSSDYENNLKTFLASEKTELGDNYFMGYNTKKGTYMVVAEIKMSDF